MKEKKINQLKTKRAQLRVLSKKKLKPLALSLKSKKRHRKHKLQKKPFFCPETPCYLQESTLALE